MVTEELLEETRVGDGGFLVLRRLTFRNRYEDGSTSAPYVVDFVERPRGLDATCVVLFRPREDGWEVLLRSGMRAPVKYGRGEDPHPIYTWELVAGLLEKGDDGVRGRLARTREEIREEAGYDVQLSQIESLGAPMIATPSVIPEKLWFYACPIGEDARQLSLAGDGSPMEEGATTKWVPLEEALGACERGEINDMKTELGLRRFKESLPR